MNNKKFNLYDVIVIGSGIAGSEAAIISSAFGSKTLAINISADNPSVLKQTSEFGGIINQPILSKIDALGGFISTAIYKNTIAQKSDKEKNTLTASYVTDKRKFSLFYKYYLENQTNLDFRQGLVAEIEVLGEDDNKKYRVNLEDGSKFLCKAIIISVGTFLDAKIFWGNNEVRAGRHGEVNSEKFSNSLKSFGYVFKKEKIFIGPSIDRKTLNFRRLKKIKPDENNNIYCKESESLKDYDQSIIYQKYYSFKSKALKSEISETVKEFGNNYTKVIFDKLVKNDWYNYKLETGKNNDFEIELLPEGDLTGEMYLKDFNFAFSAEEQQTILNKFYGLENAQITRPGYCIEYDALECKLLNKNMESILHESIYFAGEVNGAFSYEAAALQGLVAGIFVSLDLFKSQELLTNTDFKYLSNLINQTICEDLILIRAGKSLKEIILQKIVN